MNKINIKEIDALLSDVNYDISILSNCSAYLYERMDNVSWVGFYINKAGLLKLGPFQGPIACTEIKLNAGVVGTCAFNKESIVVDDVHTFKGHIACDSNTNSEIVLPVIINNEVYAVLDIDSHEYSNFDSDILETLKEVVTVLEDKIKDII